MTAYKLPSLPANEVTGVTAFLYTNAVKDWRTFPIKASDTPALPIAWTTYQQALFDGTTEAAYIAANAYTLPTIRYGVQNTLIRLPRIVLYNFDAFPGISLSAIFDPIAAQLQAANVIVAKNVDTYADGTGTIFRQFLPHYAEETLTESGPIFAALSFTLQKVRPTDWVAGKVLYLDALKMFSFGGDNTFGPGAAGTHSTNLYQEFSLTSAFGAAQINSSFSRYESFGHHLVYTLADAADFFMGDLNNIRDRHQATVEAAVATANGASLRVFDGDWPVGSFGTVLASQTAVETEYRNKVISFFGL